jgi:hypothetical protein
VDHQPGWASRGGTLIIMQRCSVLYMRFYWLYHVAGCNLMNKYVVVDVEDEGSTGMKIVLLLLLKD